MDEINVFEFGIGHHGLVPAAVPAVVLKGPENDGISAHETLSQCLSVTGSFPQLGSAERAAHCSLHNSRNRLHHGQVEPDDALHSGPLDGRGPCVVSVQHPSLSLHRRRDARQEFFIIQTLPIRTPEDRIHFDVRYIQNLGQSPTECGLARTARSDDVNTAVPSAASAHGLNPRGLGKHQNGRDS